MDKISPIKKRILQFIDYKKITKSEFCKNTDISYSNLKGKSLESEIGGEYLTKMILYYDEISSEWLITGKGEMLKSSESIVQNNTNGHNVLGHKNKINQDKSSDELISFLKKQLEEKDEQIKRKDEQIKMKEETINKLTDKIQSN